MNKTLVPIFFAIAGITITQSHGRVYERVAASDGKPVRIVIGRDASQVSLPELANADLIVRAKLVRIKSYVTADGNHIYTDYHVVPSRVIADRSGFGVQQKPGPAQPIELTLYGGEVFINGVKVTFVDTSQKAVSTDADLLIFLNRNRETDHYELIGGSSALFEVQADGRLKSLRGPGDGDRRIDGMDVEGMVAEVAKLRERALR